MPVTSDEDHEPEPLPRCSRSCRTQARDRPGSASARGVSATSLSCAAPPASRYSKPARRMRPPRAKRNRTSSHEVGDRHQRCPSRLRGADGRRARCPVCGRRIAPRPSGARLSTEVETEPVAYRLGRQYGMDPIGAIGRDEPAPLVGTVPPTGSSGSRPRSRGPGMPMRPIGPRSASRSSR